ncbi:MAG: STAS domain-containing protein [Leptolyngbya sp. BL-A-14]
MITIFNPIGILDGTKAKQLHLEMNDAMTSGSTIALIDMQAVTLIDSSALGELVIMLKAMQARGGELCFCSVGQQPQMVFELTGMEKVFQVFHNLDEVKQQKSMRSY